MLRKFFKDGAGSIAITMSIALVPLFIGAGVAVDMIRANNVNTALQAAADAAALAGATSKQFAKPKKIQAIVNDYLSANNALKLLASSATVTQGIDATSGAFKVTVKGQVSTTFMKLVGIPTMEVSGMSAVSLGMQGLEVALVLDNTGSMAGTKLAALKIAAKGLISVLVGNKADYSDLKFSLVPFSKYVNVGKPNLNASWLIAPTLPASWNGCVGSRNAPDDLQADTVGGNYPAVDGGTCPTALMPLTNDDQAINTEIDAMIAQGNTYIAGGVLWGWNTLTPDVPFTEGRTAAQLKTINGRKIMVVMTDGTNTASPLYPSHDGSDSVLADANFTAMCANVKAQDIEVYTVLFEEPSLVIKGLMRDCASVPSNFYDAASNTALIDAFDSIGKQLAGVRLVQ